MLNKMWAIFHRGDNRWLCQEVTILKYIDGLPLIQLELPQPAVTIPEFLFDSLEKASEAAVQRTINDHTEDY